MKHTQTEHVRFPKYNGTSTFRILLNRGRVLWGISALFLTTYIAFAQPVAIHGALSVSGNKLVNKSGQAVSFAGNSLFWSNDGWGGEKYYNANVVSWLRRDWNSAIVRAAMGVQDNGGYLGNREGNKAKVKTVVDAAIANGMYVIIDWHSHKAEDNTNEAIEFFKEMAQTYGNTPNVIYEIYNEPINSSWGGAIKPYAEKVIDAIRAIDPDNIIIVGTRFYSAFVNEPADDPIQRKNIAYTIHFYAANHKQDYRDRCQYALNKGIALFATEWGTVSADGSGNVDESETYAWMDFLKRNNISHCNWSINDKAEGASALKTGADKNGGWPDGNLTWSGGVVRGILRGYDYGTIKEGIEFSKTPIVAGARLSYAFKINYTTTESRDLIVSFLDKQGAVLGSNKVQVNGSGMQDLTITLNKAPVLGADYSYTCELRALGSSANLDRKTIDHVTIVENDPLVLIEAEAYTAMLGVETEPCVEGGEDVGYLDAGDWLSYANVNLSIAASYTVYYRVASSTAGGIISLEKDEGKTILGTVDVPNTGDWQAWRTVSHEVTLPAGSYSLGIGIPSGGYNLNFLAIVPPATSSHVNGLDDLDMDARRSLEVYPVPAHDFLQVAKTSEKSTLSILSLAGVSLLSTQSDRIDISSLPKGVYFVQEGSLTGRFIKE